MFRARLRHPLALPPTVIREVYSVGVGSGVDVIGEAGTGEETRAVTGRAKQGLLLLALSVPRCSGLDVMRALHGRRYTPSSVVLAGGVEQRQLPAASKL